MEAGGKPIAVVAVRHTALDSDRKNGKSVPSWLWWAAAAVLILLLLFGLRSNIGENDDNMAGPEQGPPVAGNSEEPGAEGPPAAEYSEELGTEGLLDAEFSEDPDMAVPAPVDGPVRSGSSAAAEPLPDLKGRRIGIAEDYPYLPLYLQHPDSSGEAGLDYDLWWEICGLLNCVPVFIETAWDGLIVAVGNGQFDAGGGGITLTNEREEVVIFSDPYVVIEQRLLGRRDEERFTRIEDIIESENFTLGAQIGSIDYSTATGTLQQIHKFYFGPDCDIACEDLN